MNFLEVSEFIKIVYSGNLPWYPGKTWNFVNSSLWEPWSYSFMLSLRNLAEMKIPQPSHSISVSSGLHVTQSCVLKICALKISRTDEGTKTPLWSQLDWTSIDKLTCVHVSEENKMTTSVSMVGAASTLTSTHVSHWSMQHFVHFCKHR